LDVKSKTLLTNKDSPKNSTKKAHQIWCAFPWSDRKRHNLKPIYPGFRGFVLVKRDNEFVEEMKGKLVS
jgi:hypothetical protein